MKVLFVNACIRDEDSRTLELCRDYLDKLKAKKPDCEVKELVLNSMDLEPMNLEILNRRNELLDKNDFNDPMFDYAKEIIGADHIVVGAPYWDLQFPALLKIYLERCSVTGLTYIYGQDGVPTGQCKADSLVYITTAGGPIGEFNFGYDYIKGLCLLFGITKTYFAGAEGLDIWGNDVESLLNGAKEKLTEIVQTI